MSFLTVSGETATRSSWARRSLAMPIFISGIILFRPARQTLAPAGHNAEASPESQGANPPFRGIGDRNPDGDAGLQFLAAATGSARTGEAIEIMVASGAK